MGTKRHLWNITKGERFMFLCSLKFEIEHGLGEEAAVRTIKEGLERAEKKGELKSMKGTWKGSTLTATYTFMGFSLRGSLAVRNNVVELFLGVPVPAMLLRPAIEAEVKENARKLFLAPTASQ